MRMREKEDRKGGEERRGGKEEKRMRMRGKEQKIKRSGKE